jgi:hypothetical protein
MTVVRSCGGEGSALRYCTELVTENCPDSFSTEIIKLVWNGKSSATAEDSVDPTSARDKSQENEAALILKDLLRDGKRPAVECSKLLKDEGYDLEKLNSGRVRKKAGADSRKFPGDRFNSWFLPEPALSPKSMPAITMDNDAAKDKALFDLEDLAEKVNYDHAGTRGTGLRSGRPALD